MNPAPARSRPAALHTSLVLTALLLGAVGSPATAQCRPWEIQRSVPIDAAPFDKHGWSVAIARHAALVASRDDDDRGPGSGSVYLYERGQEAPGWLQRRKLVPADGAPGDQFGHACDLSRNTTVVGARYTDDNGANSGSVYVFRRDLGGPGRWGQSLELHPSDAAPEDEFGTSVAIDGETLVVGSMNGNAGAGAAYVFRRDLGGPGQWGEVKRLVASDAANEDRFGRSVAVHGDRILVMADGNDDAGSSSGAAYVFERDAGGAESWGEVAKLTADDAAPVDHFGIAGAIHGGVVVIGAHRDDDNGIQSGSAYVFERDLGGPASWGQRAKLTASDGVALDSFGRSVAISGGRILVGAYQHTHGAPLEGGVYAFERDQGGPNAWGEVAELLPSAPSEEDLFGWSVDLDGEDVLVGAPHTKETAANAPGSAWFFRCSRTRALPGPPPWAMPLLGLCGVPWLALPGAPLTERSERNRRPRRGP